MSLASIGESLSNFWVWILIGSGIIVFICFIYVSYTYLNVHSVHLDGIKIVRLVGNQTINIVNATNNITGV